MISCDIWLGRYRLIRREFTDGKEEHNENEKKLYGSDWLDLVFQKRRWSGVWLLLSRK